MVDSCANPACGKPLRYLRDGQVFLFQTGGDDGAPRRLEHYWLCGDCLRTRSLSQDASGMVRLVTKLPQIQNVEEAEGFAPDAA